ncbi:radical SAM family heme chaperone HemW [Candidatus Nitrospira bockiana]
MPGLYIHVPFCRSRCHFCAFYLQIHREDRAAAYVQAFLHEVHLHAKERPFGEREVSSIYFGGGTPTSLPATDLARMLAELRTFARVKPDAEVSIEAAPDTVTVEELQQLYDHGFNRVSFGVQTMEAVELRAVGRRMLPDVVVSAVRHARSAGFHNINLDVIYGLPGQTLASWQATLDEVLALGPPHVSCYALTVEEKTRLAVDVRRGHAREPDPTLQNDMEDLAAQRLEDAGFERYEISNWARPGFACRHNLLYWQGGEYLGLGPSAQSYLAETRAGNTEDLADYLQCVTAGQLPIAEREDLTEDRQRRERLIFGLRMIQGVPMRSVGAESGARPPAIERLLQAGLLEQDRDRLKLTALGRRFADSVAVDLL